MNRKKTILLGIAMGVNALLLAQPQLEKVWKTDTTTLRNPESVLYDSLSNSIYVSCMGAGKIARIGTDGKIMEQSWVAGLASNKGTALFNGLLYTAETAAIAVIDVKKASVIKRIQVQSAIMLNDVAVDAKGIVYVTDTRAGKVYRIEADSATIYLENLPGANGLLCVNNDLYVLTTSSVVKVDASKAITKLADGFENGLDGIVMLANNEFIISNYKGILYYLNADGTKYLLVDTRANGIMANDISYNSKTKMLFVPSFATSCVIAYQVK
jgi:outer membrane protein assembly factor BamB